MVIAPRTLVRPRVAGAQRFLDVAEGLAGVEVGTREEVHAGAAAVLELEPVTGGWS